MSQTLQNDIALVANCNLESLSAFNNLQVNELEWEMKTDYCAKTSERKIKTVLEALNDRWQS